MKRRFLVWVAGVLLVCVHGLGAQPLADVPVSRVDAIFSKWTDSTPGCSVGVMADGKVVLEKSYGMADLEHNVRVQPRTIFEAGSVSKQFTAAAILLLAREGKLSLEDPARKYIPELPDYGAPLTIRQMIEHTSGLRDWGSVEGIAGWPRTTRANTHAHVLDVVSRQKHLNFSSGTNWSYSNTGYNLAAIIVSRVSGQSFADFTRTRLFEPLGMTRTSWRDDYTRIVKDRAMAYTETPQGDFRTNMPFENVHGNGGLLTTVGDLLRWNENFVEPKVGGVEFVREQQTEGRFNDGSSHDYASGLRLREYKGLREVNHGGATAGYRAFLTRFPDQHLSVSILCNATSAQAEAYAHDVADLYLARHLKAAPPASIRLTASRLDALAGLFRHTGTGDAMSIVRDGESLRVEGGGPLRPLTEVRFMAGGNRLEFEGARALKVTLTNGRVETWARVERVSPGGAELAALSGSFYSPEAEVRFTVVVRDGKAELHRRPDSVFPLKPLYADAFDSGLGTIRFHRGADGRVTEFSVIQDRVWDLRFKREPGQ